eukprot:8413771-Pyramimonas_sp.AAC.1
MYRPSGRNSDLWVRIRLALSCRELALWKCSGPLPTSRTTRPRSPPRFSVSCLEAMRLLMSGRGGRRGGVGISLCKLLCPRRTAMTRLRPWPAGEHEEL